jgi:hypothetical protein
MTEGIPSSASTFLVEAKTARKRALRCGPSPLSGQCVKNGELDHTPAGLLAAD